MENCCLVSDIPECTEVVEDKALIFKKIGCKRSFGRNCKTFAIIRKNVMELKKRGGRLYLQKV